jgi:surface protein
MSYMFYESSFNRDVSTWDTSSVTDMSYTFCRSLFNGDVSNWNVSRVTTMAGMLAGAPAMAVGTYDALLDSWAGQALQTDVTFDAGTAQYSAAAEAARQSMIDEHGWTIHDAGLAE